MRNPTIKDVADRAGVSISAVSIYLNDKPGIGKDTHERIALAIADLGYKPRNNARRSTSNGFLSLLVEKLPLSVRGDQFYAEVTEGIQDAAEALGYHLTINVLNQPTSLLPRTILDQRVAGILAIGGGDITDELLANIADQQIPLVTVDNECLLRNIDSVVADNQHGAYAVTRHLIELGHRQIAIIRGPAKYKSLTERYYGYVQAMLDAGIVLDTQLIQAPLSKGIPRKGYLEMESLLRTSRPPTAVFAVTDRTAIGAMDYLAEHGMHVPSDISVASFDHIHPGTHADTALTTVGIDRHEMGRVAVQRLHHCIQDASLKPVKIVMYAEVITGESTAPLSR
jgi:LacI family transcriptional regulator